jgi:hypothetical protein
MHQHALRTAATLYVDGTWTKDAAAKYAGVRPTRLEETVEKLGIERSVARKAEKVRVAAD